MKKLIVSSCGTSFLTNGAAGKRDKIKTPDGVPLGKLIYQYANAGNDHEVPEQVRTAFWNLIRQLEANVEELNPESASKASAELNALLCYYDRDVRKARGDYHILICTDTWLGRESAKMVKKWLRSRGLSIDLLVQKDLRTDNLEEFQLALKELGAKLSKTLKDYEAGGYHIVFNLNGGFKSFQGFLQTLGMFRAHEIIYLFESGTDLMRIPKIPVKINMEPEVRDNLLLFRRLNAGLGTGDTGSISEALLLILDGETTLSTWGDMAWQEHHASIYRAELHPSPSEKIHFSRRFEQEAEKLNAKRKLELNRRLDQLARYLELPGQPNPSSLTFKGLKGRPVAGSTHEFYAWSDGGAWRAFGHFEEDVFILDDLRKHL